MRNNDEKDLNFPLTIEYFMRYMTQAEFESLRGSKPNVPYSFNVIKRVENEK